MSTSFPNAVDTFPTAADLADDTLATKPHSTLHGNLGDAIIAVEQNALVIAPATSARNVIQSSADATELTLKAFAGQTANIFVLKDEEGNNWLSTKASATSPGVINGEFQVGGDVHTSPTLHTYLVQLLDDGNARQTVTTATAASDFSGFARSQLVASSNIDGTADYVQLEFGVFDGVFMTFTAENDAASFVARAAPGQTDPVLNVKDDSNADMFRTMATGQIISNAHVAPADGDLNNSDFALWLDDTPGATCLKIKAKDSGGTVRTATVPLT